MHSSCNEKVNRRFNPYSRLGFIDGIHAPNLDLNYQTVVKGDELEKSIMAASILAKTARDNFMLKEIKGFEYVLKIIKVILQRSILRL